MISIIGIGAEGEKTLTQQAKEAVENAELLIGAGRMLGPFAELGKECFESYRPEEICDRIEKSPGTETAVLMSGDAGFYSGAKKLIKALEGKEVRVIAGISTPVYMCAALGISYENMKYVSLHGNDGNTAVNVKLNEYCFFLLGGGTSPSQLCERLCRYGLGDVQVSIGSRLGYSDEKIVTDRADRLTGYECDRLCAAVVHNSGYKGYMPSGIADSEFERTDIPMTKAEVRAAAVSALEICRDSVCWDIGSGSGSVSVEMAYRCCDGKVYAFDKKAEAYELTVRNAERFGCDNIKAAAGTAPLCLDDAPAPDKVFIGGSSGEIGGIFKAVKEKGRSADIVITAVSLETLSAAEDAFSQYGAECEITQIAVTRTRRAGSHRMLSALNPVFIIRGRLS